MIHQIMNIDIFNSYDGYTIGDLNPVKDKIQVLLDEVNEYKQQAIIDNRLNDFRQNLAGNINYEYELTKSKDVLNKIITPLIYENNKVTNHLNYIKRTLSLDHIELILDKAWINIQKKHEYNPVHSHSGIYSFVIWLEVPYYIEDEDKKAASIKPTNGRFQFITIDCLGKITTKDLPIDKTWEYKMAVFPSTYNHAVYPFYTSDSYRISVAGNFKVKL